MILSRAWYLILALITGAAVYVVSLAVGQYNRRNQAAMADVLKSDSQAVSWALQLDSRRRLDNLLPVTLEKTFLDGIKGANGKAEIPQKSKDDARQALAQFNDKLPPEYKSDALFALDREGRIVAQIGYDTPNSPAFELGGYSSVFDALHGWLRDDTWVWGQKVARVVARPVNDEPGQPIGAVVAIRWVDNGFAKEMGKLTRTNLAFYAGGQRVAMGSWSDDKDELDTLDRVVPELAKAVEDPAYKKSGRTDVHPFVDDRTSAIFVRMPGDTWETNAGFAVTRNRVMIDGPLGFIKGADDKDKANVKIWLVAVVVVAAFAFGMLFSFLEHSMPLKEMKAQLAELQTQEEKAWETRDYENAAQYKAERVRIEGEYTEQADAWRVELDLDEIVDARDIASVVSAWTGIPVSSMLQTETEKLLDMEEHLRKRIIGQEMAVTAVSDAIRRARSGLKDPRRPIGTFLFLGPTGVGKTELAKALAGFLFDDDEALLRVDMSEYREPHTVSRLFGAPPGYVGYDQGGQLTEQVRRRPYRVILFDEVEKAHPDVWNSLLQIMDDGRLTDGQGRVVDFRNTVVIMTSNVGAEAVKRGPLGFMTPTFDESKYTQSEYSAQLKRLFRPEFLNRIDEIIVFDPLNREQIRQIVQLLMHDISVRMDELGFTAELTEAAANHIAEVGYDPNYGARPLRRLLQRRVENELSKRLLKGDVKTGDHIVVDYDPEGEGENKLTFTVIEQAPIPVELPLAQQS